MRPRRAQPKGCGARTLTCKTWWARVGAYGRVRSRDNIGENKMNIYMSILSLLSAMRQAAPIYAVDNSTDTVLARRRRRLP